MPGVTWENEHTRPDRCHGQVTVRLNATNQPRDDGLCEFNYIHWSRVRTRFGAFKTAAQQILVLAYRRLHRAWAGPRLNA